MATACAYCGGPGQHPPCCSSHQRTPMCSHCRAVPGRPDWHNSPLEGRACCGQRSWARPCRVCAHAA